ncbi:ATP-binding cassette domain-containing protein [Jiangella ureilytica]|uniref:ATP-binding cassette domain-containing protein n=1 Tax=Jiangella ureilytica TaxID=2530374 RepID=A0A4R4RWK7_9ACTN|nr:oligopeptide/dipeptide ABC transporter ATP-binding protein [Jiangella ureilytica]TDC53282.1 ATP-binding cassette domain-containing protein [Jiangella ureilytica]
MSELRFDGVRVRFGTGRSGMVAVDGVDLVVPSGQVVGLVGESGSGKSTLARAAVGLAPVSDGRITLDGVALSHGGRGRSERPVQMVFQDPYSSLDPRMTIGDSVAEAIPRRALRGSAARRAEVVRLLDLVGLEAGRADAYPGQLSGGQRQRVALARALAGRPEVIIADEITSALDVSIQGTVLNLVRDLQRQLNLSMLFISHNLAVVRYVSDVIAVMYLGRIVEHGPAEDVLGSPRHPYTRDLLAAAPDADVDNLTRIESDPVLRAIADAEPADPHHPPAGCRYHPRCPVGPLVLPERSDCLTVEPGMDHPNHAACHYATEMLTARGLGDPRL